MSRQTIVIIGGSGFIGRHLAAAYQADGHRVIIVSRHPARAREADTRFEYIAALHHLYDSIRPDLLINLAGASVGAGCWTAQRKQELLQSRLQPVQAVADWLHRHPQPPRLIIQASAVGYYGNGSAEGWRPCMENAPPQHVFPSQLCQQWEAAIQRVQQESSVPVAVCRFGVVLGRDGGILPQLLKPVRYCAQRLSGLQHYCPQAHHSARLCPRRRPTAAPPAVVFRSRADVAPDAGRAGRFGVRRPICPAESPVAARI